MNSLTLKSGNPAARKLVFEYELKNKDSGTMTAKLYFNVKVYSDRGYRDWGYSSEYTNKNKLTITSKNGIKINNSNSYVVELSRAAWSGTSSSQSLVSGEVNITFDKVTGFANINVDALWNVGCGVIGLKADEPIKGNANITNSNTLYVQPFTKIQAPRVSVEDKPYINAKQDTLSFQITGAKAGNNVPIDFYKYEFIVSKNQPSGFSDNAKLIQLETPIPSNQIDSMVRTKIENFSGLESKEIRGSNVFLIVQACNSNNSGYSSDIQILSNTKVNSLPGDPIINLVNDDGYHKKYSNKSTSLTIDPNDITAGSDSDEQNYTIKYTTNNIDWYDLNTPINVDQIDQLPVYFATFDGLEYSEKSVLITYTRNTIPSLGNVTWKYDSYEYGGAPQSDILIYKGVNAISSNTDIQSIRFEKEEHENYYYFKAIGNDGLDETPAVTSTQKFHDPQEINKNDISILYCNKDYEKYFKDDQSINIINNFGDNIYVTVQINYGMFCPKIDQIKFFADDDSKALYTSNQIEAKTNFTVQMPETPFKAKTVLYYLNGTQIEIINNTQFSKISAPSGIINSASFNKHEIQGYDSDTNLVIEYKTLDQANTKIDCIFKYQNVEYSLISKNIEEQMWINTSISNDLLEQVQNGEFYKITLKIQALQTVLRNLFSIIPTTKINGEIYLVLQNAVGGSGNHSQKISFDIDFSETPYFEDQTGSFKIAIDPQLSIDSTDMTSLGWDYFGTQEKEISRWAVAGDYLAFLVDKLCQKQNPQTQFIYKIINQEDVIDNISFITNEKYDTVYKNCYLISVPQYLETKNRVYSIICYNKDNPLKSVQYNFAGIGTEDMQIKICKTTPPKLEINSNSVKEENNKKIVNLIISDPGFYEQGEFNSYKRFSNINYTPKNTFIFKYGNSQENLVNSQSKSIPYNQLSTQIEVEDNFTYWKIECYTQYSIKDISIQEGISNIEYKEFLAESLAYYYSGIRPTVSYRQNKVGINTFGIEDNDLIDIAAVNDNDVFIKFKNKEQNTQLEVNVKTGEISGGQENAEGQKHFINLNSGIFSGKAKQAQDAEVSSKLGTDDKGSLSKPIYLDKGEPKECNLSGITVAKATNADIASKLGTLTIGATDKPIYLDEGQPKECDLSTITVANTLSIGGMKILTGNNTCSATTAAEITFTEGTFTSEPTIIATWNTPNEGNFGALKIREATKNGFKVIAGGSLPSAPNKFNWIAIGV